MSEVLSRHCFSVLVDNEPGVLARIVGLFSGRGYNIDSLTVDEIISNSEGRLSRITIVSTGTPMIIDQIKAQLSRLIPVRQVINLTRQGKFVESSVAFIKLIADAKQRSEATRVAEKAGASIADITDNAIIFSLTTTSDRIDVLTEQLRALGTIELARTGIVAMACGEAMLTLTTPPQNYVTATCRLSSNTSDKG